MFTSMTGYGRASQSFGNRDLVIELKSVNHKGLEINVRAPLDFSPIEPQIIKFINRRVQRGRVDVFIGFNSLNNQSEPEIKLDSELAKEYFHTVKNLSEQLHIPGEINIGQIISLPGIIKTQSDNNRIPASWNLIEPLIGQSLTQLIIMRKKEGMELFKDIMSRMKAIEQNVKKIHKLVPKALKQKKMRLQDNIKNLFDERTMKIDSNQIMAAAVTLLDQCDITEELVRVDSHITQFHEAVKSGESVGRRLDFIVQELFREFTTIGAKTNHPDIGNKIVDIKTDLDKIKQQIANIE